MSSKRKNTCPACNAEGHGVKTRISYPHTCGQDDHIIPLRDEQGYGVYTADNPPQETVDAINEMVSIAVKADLSKAHSWVPKSKFVTGRGAHLKTMEVVVCSVCGCKRETAIYKSHKIVLCTRSGIVFAVNEIPDCIDWQAEKETTIDK